MRTRSLATTLALASFVGALACGGASDVPAGPAVRVGIPSGPAPEAAREATREAFAPFASALSDAVGASVHIVPRSRDELLNAFESGEVNLAWCDAATGLDAVGAVPGARAIARGSGRAGAFYVVAHRGTDLEWSDTFPDLEARTCALGPRGSASGHLMPFAAIRDIAGRDPAAYFQTPPRFTDSARETLERVADGELEVGFVPRAAYEELIVEGVIDPRVCRAVWRSSGYADEHFVAHPDLELELGPGVTDRLLAALLAIDSAELLSPFRISGFEAVGDEDFSAVTAARRPE